MQNGLTQRRRSFCLGYFESGNATQSAIQAGYSPKYAATNTFKLLSNTNIKLYLEALRQAAEDKSIMSVVERKQRLSEISRANLVDFVDEDGNITLESENPGALQEVSITELRSGKDEPISTYNKKVKLHNPMTAIDLLNKMDRVYEPDGTTNILNQILNVNVVSESARKATERIVQGERTG